MYKEFLHSVNRILTERITSPLFGLFVLSWLTFNWRPLVILVFDSSLTVNGRIDLITNKYSSLEANLIYPLGLTIILMLFYPLVSTGSYWLWEKWSAEKRKVHRKFDEQVPLTIEQSIELKREIGRLYQRMHEADAARDNEVESLRNDLRNAQEAAGDLGARSLEQEKLVEDLQQKLNDAESEKHAIRLESERLTEELKKAEARYATLNKQLDTESAREVSPSINDINDWDEWLDQLKPKQKATLFRNLRELFVAHTNDHMLSNSQFLYAKKYGLINELATNRSWRLSGKAEYLFKYVPDELLKDDSSNEETEVEFDDDIPF